MQNTTFERNLDTNSKTNQASTGIEPMTFALPVRCSANYEAIHVGILSMCGFHPPMKEMIPRICSYEMIQYECCGPHFAWSLYGVFPVPLGQFVAT